MPRSSDRRSPLALVLLALLAEQPMHPYRMQQVIMQRGKDKIANVAQRNSVYQTIGRLLRSSLIAVREVGSDERHPERTVYAITDAGWTALRSWTRVMLADPTREFPEFPAALASLMLLDPKDVLADLELRVASLEAEIESEEADIASAPGLPRLFTLDDEYRLALQRAELRWISDLLGDLQSGELSWSAEWIRQIAERFSDPNPSR